MTIFGFVVALVLVAIAFVLMVVVLVIGARRTTALVKALLKLEKSLEDAHRPPS